MNDLDFQDKAGDNDYEVKDWSFIIIFIEWLVAIDQYFARWWFTKAD